MLPDAIPSASTYFHLRIITEAPSTFWKAIMTPAHHSASWRRTLFIYFSSPIFANKFGGSGEGEGGESVCVYFKIPGPYIWRALGKRIRLASKGVSGFRWRKHKVQFNVLPIYSSWFFFLLMLYIKSMNDFLLLFLWHETGAIKKTSLKDKCLLNFCRHGNGEVFLMLRVARYV